MELIDKAAIIAEIKRLTKKNELYLDENTQNSVRFQKTGAYSVLNDLLHFLDTLETKVVDLENSMTCNVDWYDGFLLDYTQEQQDTILENLV